MNDSVTCANLSIDEARHRRQLYYVLVLLVTGRALNKVQSSGEAMVQNLAHGADSLAALVHSEIQVYGDSQAATEAFERCVREYEGPEHTR